jgi:hypothetical protein
MHPESAPSFFPWGKYSYKRLPIGIAGSPNIFQSKMLEVMEDLEYVQAYLDDLLCISRSSLEDHLKKLEEVLRCLCDAGLKVNMEKMTFCTLDRTPPPPVRRHHQIAASVRDP